VQQKGASSKKVQRESAATKLQQMRATKKDYNRAGNVV
jgi:hypothetical protein